MKQIVTQAFLFILCTTGLWAQNNGISVKGIIIEASSRQPIELATIALVNAENDVPFDGTNSDADGSFELKTTNPNFYVEVSFIGFETKQIKDFTTNNGGTINLGTIEMGEGALELENITVTGEKSSTEFKLDKRVFNVGKDLSSTGASALEVLNNVPSVNVDIEGAISLRGNEGVQVLINGKPSVLASEQGGALGSITADMIQRVEVITNPSAKYDAEGTSGIINIVLKKEEREGINGSISINTGIPDNHSIGLSLNRRTNKFNFFGQLGAGYRSIPSDSRNINNNLLNQTVINSTGREFRNEQFYNVILGTDYNIDDFNVITLSGFFAYEAEDQPSTTNFERLIGGELDSRWQRTEETTAQNPKYQYELQYKRTFRDNEDHTLLFSALGNLFAKDQSSEFENRASLGTIDNFQQQTRTDFGEFKQTFKLDYTKPFLNNWTVETGLQYVVNDVSNDFAVLDLVGDAFVENPGLTNIFEYEQNVFGAYVTGAYEKDKWGLKAGLRAENTDLSTFLVNTNASNNQNFTDLFPSLHTSYKLSERVSLQAGYSRRIFRPRLWDLNPFFNIRNNFSFRTGNPDLLPEYTDSYEVTSIFIFNKASINGGVYHLFSSDVVERVSVFEDDVNITMPFNIGTNQTTGIEVNGKYSVSRNVTFLGDFNINFFNREGEFEGRDFDFTGDRYSAKLTSKFKLPYDIDFEITGQYRSAFRTIQGSTFDNAFADMGLRKKVLKKRGVVNLSIRDIFASRVRESEAIQPTFSTYNFSQRGRFITLGFSYSFGKGEAMEYSGRRR